jgi:hypothetical protein
MSAQPAKTDSEDRRGIEAARMVAAWEIGDEGWANTIIAAYNDPSAEWVQAIRKQREVA